MRVQSGGPAHVFIAVEADDRLRNPLNLSPQVGEHRSNDGHGWVARSDRGSREAGDQIRGIHELSKLELVAVQTVQQVEIRPFNFRRVDAASQGQCASCRELAVNDSRLPLPPILSRVPSPDPQNSLPMPGVQSFVPGGLRAKIPKEVGEVVGPGKVDPEINAVLRMESLSFSCHELDS